MASGTAPCSDEVFVVIWERCKSLSQVAEACGYPNRRVASHRATRLRRRGVRLRLFITGGPVGHRDGEAGLNWLARRTRKDWK